MKFKAPVLVLFTLLLMSVASFSTKAALVTFNGQNVGVLDLTGQVNTFSEFYQYNSKSAAVSANTGLEVVNRVVMFVAQLNGEYGIFTIANKFNAGGANGHLKSTITSTSGSVLFTDDPQEYGVNSLTFYWAGKFTDGFVFSNFDGNFTFNQELKSFKGIDGLQFVNFTDGTLQSAEYSDLLALSTGFTVQVDVNAPSVALLFFAGLLGFFRFKR